MVDYLCRLDASQFQAHDAKGLLGQDGSVDALELSAPDSSFGLVPMPVQGAVLAVSNCADYCASDS